ncbi:MAG: bifunctional riboflavin kinase/FAD synthetase [Halothiobacillus sp.]
MKLIRGLTQIPPLPQGSVVTLGNFDGVHLGHQAVLRQAAEGARRLAVPLVVVIFEPLPREFFNPTAPVARLTRLRERVAFMAALGLVDYLLVLPFNYALAQMPAAVFMQRVLGSALRARHCVIGDDFRFGAGRQGDLALLRDWGSAQGMTVEAANSFLFAGERVSSTRIRAHLAQRDVVGAAHLLGRPFTLCGRVIHGDKRGRLLGFPTANVALQRRLSPLRGVFVVRVLLADGGRFAGVANVGTRPTVAGTDARLEVHVFDFNRDVYGELLQVEFLHPLRDEQKFNSLNALTAQIFEDAARARAWLACNPANSA